MRGWSGSNDPEHEIALGTRFLSPAGQIWTVRHVTAERFVMASASPSGDRGIVVDLAALLQMVQLGGGPPDVTAEQLTPPPPARRADPVPASAADD